MVFRTACAEDALRRMAEAEPDALVGAGTILTAQQAQRAVRAGAKFIVSPGLNPEAFGKLLRLLKEASEGICQVVQWCQSAGVVVIPGVATPTEARALKRELKALQQVETAMRLGLDTLKFFPAEAP